VPWLLKNEKKPPKGFEKFFKKKDETAKKQGMRRNSILILEFHILHAIHFHQPINLLLYRRTKVCIII
jgi:hypothetical protein